MRFTEEEREETECKKTEVTSEYKLHVQSRVLKRKKKTKPSSKGEEKGTNCLRDSSQVTTYSKAEK